MSNNQPNPHRERILDLARTGMSSGEIVRAIGGITRATVIGICSRSGVPLGNQEQSYRCKLVWWEKERRDAHIHRMQMELLGVRAKSEP